MTKKATIIATIVLTCAVIAFIKNPTEGQKNITTLWEWITPW